MTTESMKPYPAYKDSGIEWIGEIPEGWVVNKFSRLAFYQEGPGLRNWQFTSEGTRVICVTNITDSGINFDKLGKYISNDEYNEKYRHFTVRKGDLLLSSSGASWGKVAKYDADDLVILNTSTIRINKNCESTLHTSFIKWILKSQNVEQQLGLLMTGSCQPNFGPTHLSQLIIPFPVDKNDQKKISLYLDNQVTKINTLIENKQKQIELLKEGRTAIINQAVTKGLNPDVPMRDSGIEWLGEIPEYWDLINLKWVIEDKLKYGANEVAELDDKKYPRYIRITDFGDDGKLKHDTFKSLPFDKAKDYFLNEGDILFARSGATVGKTFQFKNYDGLACFAGYLIKASPKTDVLSSDFLYYFTKSNTYGNWKNSIFIQATIQNIGADKYSLLPIPIPKFDEQQSITTLLDNQTTKINTDIDKIQQQITLLQEYRTALISEAVTGKIDLRNQHEFPTSQ